MNEELDIFIKVVREHQFVEAHEILEDTWRKWKNDEDLKEESYILKGLINGATALALKSLGRDTPADNVWSTFLKYEPLIDSIQSEFSPSYKKAQKLLHVKHKEFFTCKNI